MGRSRVLLKRIENKTHRHITFAKRKSGLVKKAYELSTLCDVEIALILFSPAGKLILFDSKRRWEEVIEHYLNLPEQQRGSVRNPEFLKRITTQMMVERNIYQQLAASGKVGPQPQFEEMQNEINATSSELEEVEKELRYFIRSPSFNTICEAEHQEAILDESLKLLKIRKQVLETKEEIDINLELSHIVPSFVVCPTSCYPQSPCSLVSRVHSEVGKLCDPHNVNTRHIKLCFGWKKLRLLRWLHLQMWLLADTIPEKGRDEILRRLVREIISIGVSKPSILEWIELV